MANFASLSDVETEYGGSSLPGTETRTESLIEIASARLRVLLPALEDAIAAGNTDLQVLARDVVVQAVIRRLPLGGDQQQVSSQTQTAGPWQHTIRYSEDKSGTFTDDDLGLLRDALNRISGLAQASAGTIRLGRPDWTLG